MTMGGVYDYEINPTDFSDLIRRLANTPKQDMDVVLRGLLTRHEIVDILRRIRIAEMLFKGKSYKEIQEAVNTGKTTIALVKQALLRDGALRQFIIGQRKLSETEAYLMRRLRKGK